MYRQPKAITIEREELYKRVWETPMYRLAADYGISDVGLKKICGKLNIPTPPRGYWVRLEHGWEITPEPLPVLKAGDPSIYTLKQQWYQEGRRKVREENLGEDAKKVVMGLREALPIQVPNTLRNPHKLIENTQKVLINGETDRYGMLCAWADRTINITIGPNSVNRALKIMDTIVKFLETQDIQVIIKKYVRGKSTMIELFGETVTFEIKDTSQRFEREFADGENTWNKWYYVPRGLLSLVIGEDNYCEYRTKWSDTKKRKLEDVIGNFIIGLVVAADSKRKKRQRELDKAKKHKKEQNRIAEINRQVEGESEKLKNLEQLAAQWTQSIQLKEFISAAEHKASGLGLTPTDQRQFDLWLWWAKKHAERLDPLKRGVPI